MRTYSQNRICKIFRRMLCLVLALLMTCGFDLPEFTAKAASDGMIRVKLTALGTPSTLKFTTTCAYAITSGDGMNIPSGSAVTVKASGGKMSVTCGERTIECGSSVKIYRCKSGNSGVKFTSPSKSNVFSGDLFLSASGSSITTILNIYIQNYLYGVVGYEMSNSYPLEALKAQEAPEEEEAVIDAAEEEIAEAEEETAEDELFTEPEAAEPKAGDTLMFVPVRKRAEEAPAEKKEEVFEIEDEIEETETEEIEEEEEEPAPKAGIRSWFRKGSKKEAPVEIQEDEEAEETELPPRYNVSLVQKDGKYAFYDNEENFSFP